METGAPKVFLSHASEDKDRFVVPFATALRARGIDVWVDRWEILPGDSLVQKIFEEGLKNAASVIVVLSHYSVTKRWVREELDSAVVNRINRGSKLIPVVLDDCDVPQVLQATVWEKVRDVNNVGEVVERVAAAVFNHRPKPVLGPPPIYAASSYSSLPGLSETDAFVLAESAQWSVENDKDIVDPATLFLSTPPSVSKDLLNDSLSMLAQTGYVLLHQHLGPGPYSYRVTASGLELYLANCFPEYEGKVKEVVALIVNNEVWASDSLARAASIPHKVARHILSELEMRGHVQLSRNIGLTAQINATSVSLKRLLAG